MQLSFVWEDAKKMGTVYLNGDTLMHETFTEGNLASANWFIGAEVKGEDYAYFSGHMEELKLWSKAMLPDEIYATFDAYENPNNSALAGYWKFNEGGGDYYYDISRKGNNFNENHALIVSHKVNAVITSYSIHYTKLYDGSVVLCELGLFRHKCYRIRN